MSNSSAKVQKIYVTVAVLAALLLVFTVGKNVVFVKIAEQKIEERNFLEAQWYLSRAKGQKAEMLGTYTNMRIVINDNYSLWLADYDEVAISELMEKVEELKQNKKDFSDEMYSEICELSEMLGTISKSHGEYLNLRSDMLDMMDIFSEFNRLYSKDNDGNNISFTVNEELEKVENWERINSSLEDFSAHIPNGDKVYLLVYLIKETKGECDDIRKAMNVVLNSGYSETDQVRFNGNAKKTFPGVTNGNGSKVNVSKKEDYEHYMYVSICQSLVQTLAEYIY